MQIEFIRSGGFAGIRLTANLDTGQMPAEQASTLQNLVTQAGFFNLPDRIVSQSPGVDRYVYSLTVSAEQGKHTVTVSETVVPDQLRPLLDYLTNLAMTARRT